MMQSGQPDKTLLTWPLVQQLYTRASPVTSQNSPGLQYDSRLVNAYGEMIPGTKDHWVYKRPGIGPATYTQNAGQAGGCYGYGIPTSNGSTNFLSIAGGLLYLNGVALPNFTSFPGLPCYFETINSAPPTVLIIGAQYGVSGGTSSAYLYTPSTGAVAKITDAFFITLALVPGIAFLDDWTFVMDTSGNIWNTQNQSNAAVWSALNEIQATNYADQGVYLARQLCYVVAMKQWSTQIFYDAGAQINGQGSPLGIVPDALVPYGCAHPYSVAKIDETLIWMTTNQDFQPQIIVLDNLNPTIVSSPSVERILKNFQAYTGYFFAGNFGHYNAGLYSWGIKIAGHRLYGLTLPTNNITLVFDIDQKLWYIWTDPYGNFWPYAFCANVLPNLQTGTAGVQYVQHIVNGTVYSIGDMYLYPTDSGVNFNVDIYTPSTDFSTLRSKLLNNMYFESDVIKGNKMYIRATDDDYQTWSNFREVRLDYSRPELDDEGSFERRAYHIRHSLPAPFRIRSTALDMDVGIL